MRSTLILFCLFAFSSTNAHAASCRSGYKQCRKEGLEKKVCKERRSACFAKKRVNGSGATHPSFACSKDYHACIMKGGKKACAGRQQECLKKAHAIKTSPRRAVKKATKTDCFKRYGKCVRTRGSSVKECRAERKACDAGETEIETPEAALMKKKRRWKTKADGGPCFRMSVQAERCGKPDAKLCKRFSNLFYDEDACNMCLKYRLKMRKHELPIVSNSRQIVTCKPHKRDMKALGKCMKGLKGGKERLATGRYFEAQTAIEAIVAEAKQSGIPDCGNFSRLW